MWALRRASLPLRRFNVRASCIKSVSATWVEHDSGMLESSRMAYGRFLLPNMFYHSGHASLKFTMSRRELSSQDDASSTKDENDLEDGFSELETPASESGNDEFNDIKDGEEPHGELEFSDTEVEPSEKKGRRQAQSEIFKLIDSCPNVFVHVLMDKWVEEGKELSRQDISLAMVNLRRHKLYLKAFHLSEWVASKSQLEVTERDHSKLHDSIAKLIGLSAAEKHVYSIPEFFEETMKGKNIERYIRTNAVLVWYYISAGLKEKAEDLLKKMEGENLKENPWLARYLLPLYAILGKADEVGRIWEVCQAFPQIQEYLAAIEAFGKLKKIDEAEAVFEMMSRRWKLFSRNYEVMLNVYANNKMLTKGKDLIKLMEDSGCKIDPFTWDNIVTFHIQAGELEKADTILEKAIMKSKFKPLIISRVAIMEQYAKRGDVHNSEKMLHKMKQAGSSIRPRHYEILLEAYINAKLPAYGIRDRMKADNIFPDRDFVNLLVQVDAFMKNPASDLLD